MLTPPASPRSSLGTGSFKSSSSLGANPTQAIYLKAIHAYEPESVPGQSEHASCLPLQINTIIYIHSIHTSGWADGTLLSGQRGWFPSNYCEPYAFGILVPLMNARDTLEDITRRAEVPLYTSEVANVVACVRHLLEDTDCLTRESPLVRQSEFIRNVRKALLSELSGLVNITRRASLNLFEAGAELSRRTGRILIRAGLFVHTVGPASGLYLAESAKAHSVEITPTPPISYDFSTATISENQEQENIDAGLQWPLPPNNTSPNVLQSLPTSASQQLEMTHEALLSHLAAFIGRLHLQSQVQTASHILLATRQCVNAARALLASLETVCTYHPDVTLTTARDQLYTDITNLVTRAREIGESQEGIIFDTRALITAATGIVRGAGQCTSRARYLIETLGDFKLDEQDDEGPADARCQSLVRDTTSSSLASIADHRQSRDVQTQVESLAIRYKKIAPLEPRKEDQPEEIAIQVKDLGGASSASTIPPTPTSICDATADAVHFSEEDLEMSFSTEGQVMGGTLASIVAHLTPYDRVPEPQFLATFFLTFRSFVSPEDLTAMIASRFSWTIEKSASDAAWDVAQGKPIRLRVYNVLKCWLEQYWRAEEDSVVLLALQQFADGLLLDQLSQAGKRLGDLVRARSTSTSGASTCLARRHRSASMEKSLSEVTPPISNISKAQMSLLRTSFDEPSPSSSAVYNCSIVDFDDLEIARQLTLIESELFCAITPVELVGQEFAKKEGVSRAVNIKAMSSASTDLAGWVADSILHETEQKKRTAVLRQWIKICERCAQLNNYNTLMAILCALNSSTIARLKRTWDGLSRSQRNQVEYLRTITDHQRNYAVYRAKIKQSEVPCLPYLGLYRTDLTFVDEGNPNARQSKETERVLINFDKHVKTARIVSELESFQVPYNFTKVPELRAWIVSSCLRMRKSSTDLSGNLWRRSLIIEPKAPAAMKREPSVASSHDSETRSTKLSFLPNWT